MGSSASYHVRVSAALALLYVVLYQLSDVISGSQVIDGIASILFLPAFVRLLGFLIVGCWIIPALFVAGIYLVFIGAYDLGPGHAGEVIITAFTAVGGPLGVHIASQVGKLDASLSNLTPLRLLALSIGCSAGNALFYRAGLTMIGLEAPLALDSAWVFVGDMAGTWVIIYLIKTGLTIYGRSVGR